MTVKLVMPLAFIHGTIWSTMEPQLHWLKPAQLAPGIAHDEVGPAIAHACRWTTASSSRRRRARRLVTRAVDEDDAGGGERVAARAEQHGAGGREHPACLGE